MVLDKLIARVTWIQVSKLRHSLIAKVVTVFSIAAFGLADLATPLQNSGVDIWRLKSWFIGSTLFLIGYVIIAIRLPNEFQGSRDLDEIVDRMSKIQNYEFYKS